MKVRYVIANEDEYHDVPFRACWYCADPYHKGPWPNCERCHGAGRLPLLKAIDQYVNDRTSYRYHWWRLGFVRDRLFGKCWTEGCKRRPQWRYIPHEDPEIILACDEHVSRGCCGGGTLACCEWDPLPFFTGTYGEGDDSVYDQEEQDAQEQPESAAVSGPEDG